MVRQRVALEIGRTYGHLTVLSESYDASRKNWMCVCICGKCDKSLVAYSRNVLRGLSTQCSSCRNRTHGHCTGRTSPTLTSYMAMLRRCFKDNFKQYADYGGRGITVCPQWLGPDGFSKFLADVGERPSREYSLDRKDHNGNYEPNNVRWATKKQQQRNMRSSRILLYNGQARTMAEWAEVAGLSYKVFSNRIHCGWSVADAITRPLKR